MTRVNHRRFLRTDSALHAARVSIFTVALLTGVANADTLSVKSDFVRRLREPHSALVQGKEFREALRQVARDAAAPKQAINIWVDRKVDPNLQVYPGALGPTRYASLMRIAASAGCVCYPIDNCVIVGRSEWVDGLVAQLSTKTRSRSAASTIDVNWPELTTPNEALQQVRRSRRVRKDESLPHDLWPANRWSGIRPAVAESLIRGQFQSEEAATQRISRSYRFANTKAFEATIVQADPSATFKRSAGSVILTGTGASHRQFAEACLGQGNETALTKNAIETLEKDKRTFKLEVRNEAAGAIIKQLATVAQVTCEFTEEANPQLRKLVTFSVKDQTLWAIIQQVGLQAGLRFQSVDGKLRVLADTPR